MGPSRSRPFRPSIRPLRSGKRPPRNVGSNPIRPPHRTSRGAKTSIRSSNRSKPRHRRDPLLRRLVLQLPRHFHDLDKSNHPRRSALRNPHRTPTARRSPSLLRRSRRRPRLVDPLPRRLLPTTSPALHPSRRRCSRPLGDRHLMRRVPTHRPHQHPPRRW